MVSAMALPLSAMSRATAGSSLGAMRSISSRTWSSFSARCWVPMRWIVVFAQRHALEQTRRELHQAAGLPEALVLLEQGDQVLERRMEGVGLPHLLGDLLDAGGDDVARILGLLDLLRVLLGHVGDDPLAGHLVDEAGLQDLVDLVAGQLNRRDRHRLAAGFLLQVRDRVGQRLGLRLVAAGRLATTMQQLGSSSAALIRVASENTTMLASVPCPKTWVLALSR
jgi:hypothetical protein